MRENPTPDYPVDDAIKLTEIIINILNDYGEKYKSKAMIMDTLIHIIAVMSIHLDIDKDVLIEALEYTFKVSDANKRIH